MDYQNHSILPFNKSKSNLNLIKYDGYIKLKRSQLLYIPGYFPDAWLSTNLLCIYLGLSKTEHSILFFFDCSNNFYRFLFPSFLSVFSSLTLRQWWSIISFYNYFTLIPIIWDTFSSNSLTWFLFSSIFCALSFYCLMVSFLSKFTWFNRFIYILMFSVSYVSFLSFCCYYSIDLKVCYVRLSILYQCYFI